VPELDGIRGVAIAGVMALHFVGAITPTNAIERTASRLSTYGGWGVDLFFVLSGFLITGILIKTRDSPHYLRNFYVRRTLRIFPLYYAVLFVLLVGLPSKLVGWFDPEALDIRSVQRWIWPYLTNYYLSTQQTFSIPYISHFWSLAVEEHFYLVWPFLILLLQRRTAMRVCVALGLVSLVLRISFAAAAPDLLASYVATPCRLDALCVGSWFALRDHERERAAPGGTSLWLAALGAAIVAVSLSHVALPRFDALALSVRASLLALFFGVSIQMASSGTLPRFVLAGLNVKWLRQLGKYSYGLYVFHGMIAYGLKHRPAEAFLLHVVRVHAISSLLLITFGVTASILLAVASYELFEIRFLALKSFFENKQIAGRVSPSLAVST
jgi:peptidoglycan/LPS O-acetylase OafA/YrhL